MKQQFRPPPKFFYENIGKNLSFEVVKLKFGEGQKSDELLSHRHPHVRSWEVSIWTLRVTFGLFNTSVVKTFNHDITPSSSTFNPMA